MRRAPVLAVAVLTLAGCTSGSVVDRGVPADGLGGSITVLAAASLTGSFTRIGKDFEAAHPGTRVTLSFGPSSGLARSITGGAPADVYASASQQTMDAVTSAGLAVEGGAFARNDMEIAVPPANPGGIAALADLARPRVKVALCQAQVPCGTGAAPVLAKAGLTVRPVTEEVDVKAVLTKVRLGEVDAGVVYRTDVLAAGATVRGIEIPADVNASTTYPIATLTKAANPTLAAAFVDYVLSADGRRVLADAGFTGP